MTSPLKNVAVSELEETIAQALQRHCGDGMKFTVSVSGLQFNDAANRVDIQLSGWQQPKDNPFIRPI